ncbi:hypothetical protein NPIL_26891 [Nephila pilipes]|uniref:Uncharacterized protein n=1 Tax=Nephila pilipes TaxID=299642 RepID=A0A8X6R696_NEPPI|nr:hypothetical protein NPIL_26891 [Nephila pilipes]
MIFCFRYILQGVQRVVRPMGAEMVVVGTTKGIRSFRGLALSLIVDAVRPKMAVISFSFGEMNVFPFLDREIPRRRFHSSPCRVVNLYARFEPHKRRIQLIGLAGEKS